MRGPSLIRTPDRIGDVCLAVLPTIRGILRRLLIQTYPCLVLIDHSRDFSQKQMMNFHGTDRHSLQGLREFSYLAVFAWTLSFHESPNHLKGFGDRPDSLEIQVERVFPFVYRGNDRFSLSP